MHSRGQAWETLEFRFWTPAATVPSVNEETKHSYFVKPSHLSSSGGLQIAVLRTKENCSGRAESFLSEIRHMVLTNCVSDCLGQRSLNSQSPPNAHMPRRVLPSSFLFVTLLDLRPRGGNTPWPQSPLQGITF